MKFKDAFEIQTGYLRSRIKEDENSVDIIVYSKKHFDYNKTFKNLDDTLELDIIKLNKDKPYILKENDIVIDSLSHKAAIATKETENMFVSFNYFILKPKINIDLNYFVAWFNESDEIRRELDTILQGTRLKKLTLTQLNELKLNLIDLDKQKQIGKIYKYSNMKFNEAIKIRESEIDIVKNILSEVSLDE